MTGQEVAGRSTTSPVSGAMDAQLVEQLRSLGAWRDRALEAEARLAAVGDVLWQLRSALYLDGTDVDRVAGVLDAPGPIIAAGQRWATRFGDYREAVVIGREGTPTHAPAGTYWRIHSQRFSTIREDVLRRRWALVERAEVQG